MPNDLNAQKLREYARAGAEAALKELRAEIIAIERTFSGTGPDKATSRPATVGEESHEAHRCLVGLCTKGGVGADETLLGGTEEGEGSTEVIQFSHWRAARVL
jgi:hypothetical protein